MLMLRTQAYIIIVYQCSYLSDSMPCHLANGQVKNSIRGSQIVYPCNLFTLTAFNLSMLEP